MKRVFLLSTFAWFALILPAPAQVRPYVGYAYPAGGQQGTTFQVRLGGQALDGVYGASVTGTGVTARLVEYNRRLNNQEVRLLEEQIVELKKTLRQKSPATPQPDSTMMTMMVQEPPSDVKLPVGAQPQQTTSPISNLLARIDRRARDFVQNPSCAAIATITVIEIAVAPDAAPGRRELRLLTPRGSSNPLAFYVGQSPEHTRPPMRTATLAVLGKESQSLRKRPAEEAEVKVELPCTVNGQIASGEINSYRFTARKGQRLVLSTLARELIPYIADAVPGWFQAVLKVSDAQGQEVAYADDFRFNPDPVILLEIPHDGEYIASIHDSLFRGREDFVYRITIGEQPYITSIFPLGRQAGVAGPKPEISGWNLAGAALEMPDAAAKPGLFQVEAVARGVHSNPVSFSIDELPEITEREPNQTPAQAQLVTLPLIVNARVGMPGDDDFYKFWGKANQTVCAEISARRLGSPMDSIVRIVDSKGQILAFNDDSEDLASGVTTHHADSYCQVALPAEGYYYVHVTDTARHGGDEYGYRIRLSEQQPDFELRVSPSSIGLRSRSTGVVNVYAKRKDGFNAPIELRLKEPRPGISATPVTLWPTQTVARLTLKADARETDRPVAVTVVGTATISGTPVFHDAVPAEDRMQAFLWRHLVPATTLEVAVFNPAEANSGMQRPLPARTTNSATITNSVTQASAGTNALQRGKFTKQQIAGRLRQLRLLYDDGLLTDDFYLAKVAECESAQ